MSPARSLVNGRPKGGGREGGRGRREGRESEGDTSKVKEASEEET